MRLKVTLWRKGQGSSVSYAKWPQKEAKMSPFYHSQVGPGSHFIHAAVKEAEKSERVIPSTVFSHYCSTPSTHFKLINLIDPRWAEESCI